MRLPKPKHISPLPPSGETLASPWWLSPAGMTFGFLLPVLLLVAAVGQIRDPSVTVRTMNFLTAQYIWMALGIMVAMALAGWVGVRIEPRTVPHASPDRIQLSAVFLGCVMLLVYLFGFRIFLLEPGNIIQVFQGWRPERSEDRVAGVTSLQNFGPVFFSLIAYLVFVQKRELGKSLRFLFVVLSVCTLLRAYLWSERLAAIEVAIPFAVCWLIAPGGRFERLKRIGRIGGPYAGLPLLVLVFSVFEYARSWQSDYYHGKGSFVSFALGRLATYYYTSLNNGAGVLSVATEGPRYELNYVLQWLHKFPLGIGKMFGALVNAAPQSQIGFLELYGDPEFNNPSGVFAIVSDVGIVGGLIYFIVIGFVGGIFYRRLVRGCFDAFLLYPMFVMSFLEIYRYAYLSTSRAVPWLLASLLTLAVVYRPQRDKLIKPRLSTQRGRTFFGGQRT